jgi:hypothetical protein
LSLAEAISDLQTALVSKNELSTLSQHFQQNEQNILTRVRYFSLSLLFSLHKQTNKTKQKTEESSVRFCLISDWIHFYLWLNNERNEISQIENKLTSISQNDQNNANEIKQILRTLLNTVERVRTIAEVRERQFIHFHSLTLSC